MKKIAFIFMAALFSLPIFSQSAERVTEMLEAKNATVGQVAYLSAVYQELISDDTSYFDAVNKLVKEGQLDSFIPADQKITLSQAALIFANAVNMKGGIWYSIKHSKRYALKEMKSKGIIPDGMDPSYNPTGQEALDMFQMCMRTFAAKKSSR